MPTVLQPNLASSSPPHPQPQPLLYLTHLFTSFPESSNQFFEAQLSNIRRRADQFRQICDSVQSLHQTDYINCMTLIQCKEHYNTLEVHRSYAVEACADLVEITRLFSDSCDSQSLPPAWKESFRLHNVLLGCIRTLDSHHKALAHRIMQRRGRSDDGASGPERGRRPEMEDGDVRMGEPPGVMSVLPPRVAKRKSGRVTQETSMQMTSSAL